MPPWCCRRGVPSNLQVPDMLSEEFRFLWQFNGAIDRAEYLTEGKGPYTTLRSALPDLFWNAYDFRVSGVATVHLLIVLSTHCPPGGVVHYRLE